MRRQARISAGGALVVRSASALQVWLWLLIFIFQNEFRISRSIQPGYLDFDNLPETNFTCTGKVIGGYYADLETSCQMFHVCTVGQQEEPMDIKFLCLNGTVFDQETRVCERVDEVDCTKSEKFYSLNLELYGSTAPPIITPESKPEAQPTEQSNRDTSPSHNQEEPDPSIDDESPTTVHTSQTNQQTQSQSGEAIESTEDPLQDVKKEEPKHPQEISPTNPSSNHYEDINGEYQDEDEYEDDYSHPTTTQTTTTTSTTTTTTRKPTWTSTILPTTTTSRPSTAVPIVSSTPTMLSSLPPPAPSVPLTPTLDPSLLSPQEFIYRHRGPGSEAISFQRQGFRPADGVYITHAPPQQFDHFKYESSRTAPRPNSPRPVAFVQRPLPAPFRPTTLDPRDQLLRPGPTSQSSERYESIQHRPQQQYPQALPAQRPLPFNPYHYERKRSDDVSQETESSLTARSVGPPNITERPPSKPKSPPRVIVTASASVSDSNGKKLNYTVGNVVNAVKPIVPINYDDYKESDLLFDPFFLDVPKLQKRRKTRSNNNNRRIFTIPATATISSEITSQRASITSSPVTSRATTTKISTTTSTTTTTAAWNPDDYVDDNYEPHAYAPPVPLAVLLSEVNKFRTQERQLSNSLVEEKARRNKKIVSLSEHPSSTSSSVIQTTSSQTARPGGGVPRIPPPPTPLEAPACAPPRSLDCRTRA